MPNFAFTNNTAIYRESGGVISVELNLEGTADGYGQVLGTITCQPAGAPSGTFTFVAVSYPENGGSETAIGTGEWTQKDGDTWLTSGTTTLSNAEGPVPGVGELCLSKRTWAGTFG